MSRGDPSNKRTRDVRVRLSEDEWQLWDAAREASGRKELGAWVRAFIHEALLRRSEGRRPGDLARVVVPETNRAAVAELRRVGNNLNQLAHHANTEGRLVDVDELRRLLVEVDDGSSAVRRGRLGEAGAVGHRELDDGTVAAGPVAGVDQEVKVVAAALGRDVEGAGGQRRRAPWRVIPTASLLSTRAAHRGQQLGAACRRCVAG